MMRFDNSAQKAERMKAVAQLDPAVLAERVNPHYPEGPEEIAKLLTFLPEEKRLAAVKGLVEMLLQQ